jgi:hypothetical protein
MKKTKKRTAAMKKSHRWYDRMPALAGALDSLRTSKAASRDKCIREILALVKDKSPGLLDRFVMQFPLNLFRRRWYDTDPYIWLVFNGLRFADDDLLGLVIDCLKRNQKK